MVAGMAIRPQNKKLTSLVNSPNSGMVQQAAQAGRGKNLQEVASRFWNLKPHVTVEWDVSQQKVVSKFDQVGISWRQLSPFSQLGRQCPSGLADVFRVPHELFNLNDLRDVLSMEAWNACLTESEREILRELLPKYVDREAVVCSLLCGDNFHFGNPLAVWGASICNGGVHPDAICRKDSEFCKSQRAYYAELQGYHDKMLENLRALKDLWTSCNDSEKELYSKIQCWTEKRALENARATSEKASLHLQAVKNQFNEAVFVPGEREMHLNGCKSEVTSMTRNLHARQRKKQKIGSLQESLEKSAVVSVDGTDRLASVPCSSVNGDILTEFMCSIKVSCKQYADILDLKQAGEDLHLDSLSSILGKLNNLGIQHMSCGDEKDTSKIHQYWSRLVDKIPAAYSTFLEWKVNKLKLSNSFAQQCAHQLSQLLCQVSLSQGNQKGKVDTWTKAGESTKTAKNTNSSTGVSNPMVVWPGKHTIEGLAHERSLKGNISTPKLFLSSDSSCSGTKAVDSGKSIFNLPPTLVGQSPSNEQALSLQILSDPSLSIKSNHVPALHQAETIRRLRNPEEVEAHTKHGTQLSLHSNTQQDSLAIPECEAVVDDEEVSAIKNIWSSANLEGQELHSENGAMTNVKVSDSFFARKGPSIWESHAKPVGETLGIGPMRGGVAREEAEQSKNFQIENQCPGLDTRILDTQSVPSFPSREQLMGFSQCSSFLVHQDLLSNGHGYYASHVPKIGRTDKQGLQHCDHQDNSQSQNVGYQPVISMGLNNIQTSELSLRLCQNRSLFQMGQDKSELQQKQQILLPKFLDVKSQSEGFLDVHSDSDHTRLVSPVHTLHSIGRQGCLSESSQTMAHLSLLSESESERAQQSYGAVKELRLLADSRPTEQPSRIQQPELSQLRSQAELSEHHQQMLRRCQQHAKQPFPFHHPLQQSPRHQHSTRDFSSSISSPGLPGWSDSQQVSSGRTVSANTGSHFVPPSGHWNGGDDSMHSNWTQIEPVSGLFSRCKNEDGKLSNAFAHWDQLPQNAYADNGLQIHGQYVKNSRVHTGGAYCSADDCQSFQGPDDWSCVQQLSLNHHPYSSSSGRVVYGGQPGHLPWVNVSPGTHSSHEIPHYEQQALHDHSLPKNSSHLRTPFDYC